MAIDGKLIKQTRESRNKTQEEIAEIIGRRQSYISKLENNIETGSTRGGIKGDELLRLADYLKYDPHVFDSRVSLEDGDLTNAERNKTIVELAQEVRELKEMYNPDKNDEIALRIHNQPEMRKFFALIQYWPKAMIEQLLAMAHGYYKIPDTTDTTEDKKKL